MFWEQSWQSLISYLCEMCLCACGCAFMWVESETCKLCDPPCLLRVAMCSTTKRLPSLSVQCVCVCVCVCVLSLHFLKLTDAHGGLSPEVMLTCQTSKRKINKHTEVGKHCYYSEVIQRWCMCVRVNLKSVNVTEVIHLQVWTKVLWVYIH